MLKDKAAWRPANKQNCVSPEIYVRFCLCQPLMLFLGLFVWCQNGGVGAGGSYSVSWEPTAWKNVGMRCESATQGCRPSIFKSLPYLQEKFHACSSTHLLMSPIVFPLCASVPRSSNTWRICCWSTEPGTTTVWPSASSTASTRTLSSTSLK